MIDETTGKVTFNETEQAELNRIVEERLGREKAKYADYEDIKGIAEELKAFGYEGTPKDIREAVKSQREAAAKQAELEALKDEAKQSGNSPELLATIKKLEAKIEALEKPIQAKAQEEEAQKEAKKRWDEQVVEFEGAYPDIDMTSLADDEDFMDFLRASAPNQSVAKVWGRYSKLVGKAKAEATAKIKSNVDRSTSSGRSKSDPNGGTYGLSSTQQDLAKKAGMSLKEYSDFLKDIT